MYLLLKACWLTLCFQIFKILLRSKAHTLSTWVRACPCPPKADLFFFCQPKECLTVKEVSKLESWSTSGLWLVRFMELANQKPFQLLAKLLRIQTCIPLFKALTFKLFQLLCTLVYNFLSKLQQDRQGTIYRSHWAAWIKAACWRAWARPPPRQLRWQ